MNAILAALLLAVVPCTRYTRETVRAEETETSWDKSVKVTAFPERGYSHAYWQYDQVTKDWGHNPVTNLNERYTYPTLNFYEDDTGNRDAGDSRYYRNFNSVYCMEPIRNPWKWLVVYATCNPNEGSVSPYYSAVKGMGDGWEWDPADSLSLTVNAHPKPGYAFGGWYGYQRTDKNVTTHGTSIMLRYPSNEGGPGTSRTYEIGASFINRTPGSFPWHPSGTTHKSGHAGPGNPDYPQSSFMVIETFADPPEGGTTTPESDGYCGTVGSGELITISATTNSGWRFVKWDRGTSPFTPTQILTLLYPDAPQETRVYSFTAKFTQDDGKFVVQTACYPSEAGGAYGTGRYERGQTCTLRPMVMDGWKFWKWEMPDGTQYKSDTISFTVVSDITVVMYFYKAGDILCGSDGTIWHQGGNLLYIPQDAN